MRQQTLMHMHDDHGVSYEVPCKGRKEQAKNTSATLVDAFMPDWMPHRMLKKGPFPDISRDARQSGARIYDQQIKTKV
jgi:hypothetical protein